MNESIKLNALKMANDLNLFGKRLRSKQLELCENHVNSETLKIEANALLNWLLDNKPVKAAAAGRATTKLDAGTMAGNETRQRDNIPTIEGTRFIVTSAQNNTKPSSVLNQLIQASTDINAQLIILPTYYNKKAFSATVESEEEYFDNAIKPYLLDVDHWLNAENCVKVAAQANVPLTTKQPINSAQTLNNGELVTIVAHPKMQQMTLLRMAGEEIKTAWTTASCTGFNYLRGRAGSEAENYHAFGGVLVEIIDGKAFCTNLIQSQDGSLMFYDHALNYHTYGMATGINAPIVTVGDSHFEVFDSACFNDVRKLLSGTGAKLAVLHDIAHSESRNGHNINSASHWYKSKNTSIFNELKFVIECVNRYADIVDDVYLVESNHNNVIDRWLDNQGTASNIMFDTVNAKLYHLLKYLMCEAIDHKEDFKILALSFSKADLTGLPLLADNVRWGSAHIPEVHYNTDYCSHGHKGANGATKGLTTGKISQSMVLGHTHSPRIDYMTSRGGIITQGTTAKMDQGYNRGGGSSWGQASIITHMNGISQQYFHSL